jgi:hypothetical protein
MFTKLYLLIKKEISKRKKLFVLHKNPYNNHLNKFIIDTKRVSTRLLTTTRGYYFAY